MKRYQQKDVTDGATFDSIKVLLAVSIEDLLAVDGDPVKLITQKALDVATTLLTAWESAKDSIVPVEGE